jgi:UDP-N-acetylmuramyl pentapeptide phosphotransferase/UDP-N-acetylglucosamine-1-phosphate transferase
MRPLSAVAIGSMLAAVALVAIGLSPDAAVESVMVIGVPVPMVVIGVMDDYPKIAYRAVAMIARQS